MISFLEGDIVEKGPDRVALSVGGIGYEVLVPTSALSKLPPAGERAHLVTRLAVRDDAIVLYGFLSHSDRALFDLLVRVNGVGPKVALAFLSVLSPEAFRRAVEAGDVGALTMVPGVGKKVAGRVLLDLRGRLADQDGAPGRPLAEVREALLALGLTPQEARDAVAGLDADAGRPVEDLLREALRNLGLA